MAQIQIWTRDVKGTSNLGKYTPQHTFLIKVNDDGAKEILRGGPEKDNMIVDDIEIVKKPYTKSSIESDYFEPSSSLNTQNYQGTAIKTASQSEIDNLWDRAYNRALDINSQKYDYEPLTQNCNTVTSYLLAEMNLRKEASNFFASKDIWTLGFNSNFEISLADKGWDFLSQLPNDLKGNVVEIKNWIDDFIDSRDFQGAGSINTVNIYNFFEKAYKLGTLIDQNFYGVINGSKYSISTPISSILNGITDAMNALKDPLIIDLKNDGLNLSNPDNRYIESIYFDLNNDGIKEKTGWIIPKYEVINSTDGISNGFITNNSFYFEGDKEQSQQGWNISYSNITYTTTEGQTKQVVVVDFTTNPIGYEFNDVNLGKLATSEEGIKSLVISNPNGETVIVGADTAQNIFNNLSSFFGRSLRVFLSAVFCLGIFLEGSWASNTKHSKKECLNLTTKDKTFDNSANRIMKLKAVSEILALFRKVKLEEVSLMFFSSEPKYINNKCFWYIRLEEDHQTHLVFWKALLVDIDGSNIYEEDVAEPDSYHIIK